MWSLWYWEKLKTIAKWHRESNMKLDWYLFGTYSNIISDHIKRFPLWIKSQFFFLIIFSCMKKERKRRTNYLRDDFWKIFTNKMKTKPTLLSTVSIRTEFMMFKTFDVFYASKIGFEIILIVVTEFVLGLLEWDKKLRETRIDLNWRKNAKWKRPGLEFFILNNQRKLLVWSG